MNSRIHIKGTGITKFGELWDKSLADLFYDATEAALADAGLKITDIDQIYVGNMFAGETSSQSQLGSLPASLYGVNVPSVRVEGACASGGLAVRQAVEALQGSRPQTILVVGVEKMADFPSDVLSNLLMQAASEEERIAGATFPALYALLAQAHMEKYGTDRKHLALASVMSHENACNNEHAQFQKQITVEQVLESMPTCEPLNLLDCAPITDGAAAVILSNRKPKKDDGKEAYIIANSAATDALSLADRKSLTELEATKKASAALFAQTEISHSDIDFVELHDCFSIAAILALEDIGFVKKGDGGKAIERIYNNDPDLPAINVSGGLKACGHPAGATGVKQVAEAAMQLRGRAGKRQLENPRYALTHNIGGSGATCVMHLLASSEALK